MKLWNLAIKDQDAQALANQDMLIGHYYATSGESNFAERYSGASVSVTRIGGAGGGTWKFPATLHTAAPERLGPSPIPQGL